MIYNAFSVCETLNNERWNNSKFCSVLKKRCPFLAREAVACLVVLLPVQTGAK